jgi:ferredoxin
MASRIYYELRDILDTLPNGFPQAANGVEIKILEKVFTEEEAEIFMKLKLKFETTEHISQRTGIDLPYLKKQLNEMAEKGQVFRIKIGEVLLFKMLPYVFGIFEFQQGRLDKEFSELNEEYMKSVFGKEFFGRAPALMKVIPVGAEIPHGSVVEPYESVEKLIECAKSWGVQDCVCKKTRALTGHRCDRPMEVCMALAPIEDAFKDWKWIRTITKEEAYRVLNIAEEAGLVHMTSNIKSGHFYICNCCKCCCHPLREYNLQRKNAAARSDYIAVVDTDNCTACGTCEDRCQVNAITIDSHAVVGDCIGCGLCASTCPAGAITIVKRHETDQLPVPNSELEWFEQRAKTRGIGDDYKKYL